MRNHRVRPGIASGAGPKSGTGPRPSPVAAMWVEPASGGFTVRGNSTLISATGDGRPPNRSKNPKNVKNRLSQFFNWKMLPSSLFQSKPEVGGFRISRKIFGGMAKF